MSIVVKGAGNLPITPSDLRERCKAMYEKMGRNAMLRQSSPVDDLVAFVVAEIGRTADEKAADEIDRLEKENAELKSIIKASIANTPVEALEDDE